MTVVSTQSSAIHRAALLAGKTPINDSALYIRAGLSP